MKKVLVFILIICCLVVFSCETNISGSSSDSGSGIDSSGATDYKNKWVLVDFPGYEPGYAYINKPFMMVVYGLDGYSMSKNTQMGFQCSKNIDKNTISEVNFTVIKDNDQIEIIQLEKENFVSQPLNNTVLVSTAIDGVEQDRFESLLINNDLLTISLKYKEIGVDTWQEDLIGTIHCSDFMSNKEEIEKKAPRITKEEFFELAKQNGFGDTNTEQDESSDISNLNNKWLAFTDGNLYIYINDSILVMTEDYEPMSSVPTTLTDTIICKDSNKINITNLEEIELIATKNNENSVIVLSGKDNFIKLTASNYIQANLTGDDKNRFNSLLEEKGDLNISLKYKEIGDNNYNSVNIGQICCADFITNKDERKTTAFRISEEKFKELIKQNGYIDNTDRWLLIRNGVEIGAYVYVNDSVGVIVCDDYCTDNPSEHYVTFAFKDKNNIDITELEEIELIATGDNTTDELTIQSNKEKFVKADGYKHIFTNIIDNECKSVISYLKNNNRLTISLRYRKVSNDELKNVSISTITCSDFLLGEERYRNASITPEEFDEICKQNGFGAGN